MFSGSGRLQLKYVLMFNPILGENAPNLDEHIFQLGWNYQLVFIQLRFREIMKQQVCGIQNVYSCARFYFGEWRRRGAAGAFYTFF